MKPGNSTDYVDVGTDTSKNVKAWFADGGSYGMIGPGPQNCVALGHGRGFCGDSTEFPGIANCTITTTHWWGHMKS